MNNYECRIATLDEMNKKWDYEINHRDIHRTPLAATDEYSSETGNQSIYPYSGFAYSCESSVYPLPVSLAQ